MIFVIGQGCQQPDKRRQSQGLYKWYGGGKLNINVNHLPKNL